MDAAYDNLSITAAIALGMLQGLSEFLPISSSGHLALAQYVLGLRDVPRFFDVMLHVGTLLAVGLFWCQHAWRASSVPMDTSAAPKLGMHWLTDVLQSLVLVGIATAPAVVGALVFRPTPTATADHGVPKPSRPAWVHAVGDWREYSPKRPGLVSGFLVVTGAVLVATSWAVGGTRTWSHLRWGDALVIGLAQLASALCPGLSRSGMTISTALVLGLSPTTAVQFSLAMSIPAVCGAAVLKTRDLDSAWLTTQNLVATAIGVLVAAIVGWVCIRLLVRGLSRGYWHYFGIYVWALAGATSIVLMRAN